MLFSFGSDKDEYGMPKPYNSYLVVMLSLANSEFWHCPAIPLSMSAPKPNPPHRLVLQGGPEKAFEEMLSPLRAHPENKGLT